MAARTAVLVAIACVVGGCSPADEPTERAAEPETAPRREAVFDPLTSTIGRAQGVQQTVDDQAAEQRRRVDEAER
jgi:hypothetical protein